MRWRPFIVRSTDDLRRKVLSSCLPRALIKWPDVFPRAAVIHQIVSCSSIYCLINRIVLPADARESRRLWALVALVIYGYHAHCCTFLYCNDGRLKSLQQPRTFFSQQTVAFAEGIDEAVMLSRFASLSLFHVLVAGRAFQFVASR